MYELLKILGNGSRNCSNFPVQFKHIETFHTPASPDPKVQVTRVSPGPFAWAKRGRWEELFTRKKQLSGPDPAPDLGLGPGGSVACPQTAPRGAALILPTPDFSARTPSPQTPPLRAPNITQQSLVKYLAKAEKRGEREEKERLLGA